MIENLYWKILLKRDFEIGRYEVSLEVFYAPLVREDKREIFSNNIDIDEDSIIINLEKVRPHF